MKIAKAEYERHQAAGALKGEWEKFKRGLFAESEELDEDFTSKQQVINYFVSRGKSAAQGAAAWERGWRGSKPKQAKPYDPERYKNVRLPYIDEASGYIPSEKEKNDPRFKTALTVDVKPDANKKNAAAFGWKVSRAGIPPQARADGKIK